MPTRVTPPAPLTPPPAGRPTTTPLRFVPVAIALHTTRRRLFPARVSHRVTSTPAAPVDMALPAVDCACGQGAPHDAHWLQRS